MCDRVTNFISTAVTMKIILITISHHQAFYCWSSSWKFLIAIIKILGGKWSLTKKPAATNSQSLITEFVSWPSRRLSSVQNNGNQWIDNDYQMKHGIGFEVFFFGNFNRKTMIQISMIHYGEENNWKTRMLEIPLAACSLSGDSLIDTSSSCSSRRWCVSDTW